MDPNANPDPAGASGRSQDQWQQRRAQLEKEVDENRWRLPETLFALGTTALAQGDHAGARAALLKSSQAWQTKRILNEDTPLEIGVMLWQLGEREEARRYLEWCLESRYVAGLRQEAGAHAKWTTGDPSASYQGPPDVAGALDSLAWLAASDDQIARALELAGAASVLREQRPDPPAETFSRMQVPPAPWEIGWTWRSNESINSARATLGASADASMAQGRAMSARQAVHAALGREPADDMPFWDEAPVGLDPAASGLHSATWSALAVVVLDVLLVFFVGPSFGLGGLGFMVLVIIGSSFLWAGWHVLLLELSRRQQATRRRNVTEHVASLVAENASMR